MEDGKRRMLLREALLKQADNFRNRLCEKDLGIAMRASASRPTKPEGIRLLAFAFWGHSLIGGSERRFVDLSRHFRELGVEVYAVEASPTFVDLGMNPKYTDLLKVRKFPRLRFPFALFYLTPKAIWFCRKKGCNLIYISHHYLFENIVTGFLTSWFLRRSFVVVFNGSARSSPDSLSPYIHPSFRSSLVYHRAKGEGIPQSLYFSFIDILQTFAFRRANVCIAVSESLAKELQCQFSLKNLLVVGNGVNVSEMTHEPREKQYDAVSVGRLDPDKGTETLLKAWRIVADKKPSSKLAVIGKSLTNDLFEKYQSMVEELGLTNNVIVAGQIASRNLIVKFLNESKVFVLPTRTEGYGLAVMEAMACSLPCIISDIPALRENFQDVAVFARPGDAEGFAQAILDLLSDTKKRESLGLKAYNYVSNLDWSKISQREINIFRSLLNMPI
jgi:glycosyltransferase involved in cell wall biosynthesis